MVDTTRYALLQPRVGATFWWPRCAAWAPGAAPACCQRRVFRQRCAILGPPPALECFPWRFYLSLSLGTTDPSQVEHARHNLLSRRWYS